MKKYIVEMISMHRTVHVIEAESQEQATQIANSADDNWQEWLGTVKVDITEYTDSRIDYFKNKDYFWAGVSYKDSEGYLAYIHPSGEKIERKEIKIS
jgi:hypothetical protein